MTTLHQRFKKFKKLYGLAQLRKLQRSVSLLSFYDGLTVNSRVYLQSWSHFDAVFLYIC